MDDNNINVSPDVVEPEATPAAETGVTQVDPAPSEVAKPKQTAEENAAFAAMRRALEAERKEKSRLETLVNGFKSGLKPQGYDGEDEDIVAKLNAEAQGVSVEDYKKQMREAEAARTKEQELAAKLQEYQQKEQERQLAEDLKAIKAAFPDVKAGSVWELGDEFISIMQTGKVDAVKAYKIVREDNPAPPSIGSVKSASVQAEKDFFTSDEVDQLTPKQLDDPKILQKVMQSMTKWKSKG